jgi:hypothetical protein
MKHDLHGNGILNNCNMTILSDGNPYSIQETFFQHQFLVFICVGIMSNLLIGADQLLP